MLFVRTKDHGPNGQQRCELVATGVRTRWGSPRDGSRSLTLTTSRFSTDRAGSMERGCSPGTRVGSVGGLRGPSQNGAGGDEKSGVRARMDARGDGGPTGRQP